MKRRTSCFWLGLSLAAVSATVVGGLRAHAAPDAGPIYVRARKAAAAAKSLKATIRVTISQGKQSGEMVGPIEMLRPNFGSIKLRGSGALAKGRDQQFISNGKRIYVVAPSEKKYLTVNAEPKAENLFLLVGRILTPVVGFMDPNTLQREGPVRSVESAKVNGKAYRKVVVTAAEAPKERVLFFGPSGLLEGIHYTEREQGNVVGFKIWLENITLNAPLTARQFAYSPPAGYALRDTSNEKNLLALGAKAPEFLLPGAFGGKYSLTNLRKGKKATLISFWFLNCGPCRMELPLLAKEYPGWKKRGLEIVAINTDDASKLVQQYIFEEKLNYPVALAVNSRDKIISTYRIEAFPTVYLLDQNGKIVWRRAGFDPEGLDVAVNKALAR